MSIRTHSIRGALSLLGGGLLTVLLVLVLSLLRAVMGWDPTGWLLKNVVGKFPLLEEPVLWAQDHPTWIPLLLWALASFGAWSRTKRATFFVEGRPDPAVLCPVAPSDLGAMDLPWIEPSASSVTQSAPPADWFSVRSWSDQGRAMQVLQSWLQEGCGQGRWGWYPKKPRDTGDGAWQPLTVALLTGLNGVGKSSLAAELARRVSAPPGECLHSEASPPLGSKGTQTWHRIATWLREVLPMVHRRLSDPWHAGALHPADPSALAAIDNWQPSRPTLLVLDEPSDGALQALEALEARRNQFWHPVRVLVIDQHFPLVLDHLLDTPGRLTSPPIPLFRSPLLHLGDLRFDGGATRALWDAMHRAIERQTTDAPAAVRATFEARRRKLWPSGAPEVVVAVSKGNPLEVTLALQYLAQKDIDLEEWEAECSVDPESAASAELRSAIAPMPAFSALRLRNIAARAADLTEGHEALLAREAPSDKEAVRLQIVLATCLGGLVLPERFGLLPAKVFDELFPGRSSRTNCPPGTLRLPPVRPASIGRAYVRGWLEGRVDERHAAQVLAEEAWKQAPEAALRAALNRHVATPLLREVLLARGCLHAPRLGWAQACAAALLYRDCEPPGLEEAISALNDEDLSTFCSWLRQRIGPGKPQAVDAPAALWLLLTAQGRHLQRSGAAPEAADLALQSHWAQAIGPRAHWALERQRALATAMGTFLKTWLPHVSAGRTNPASLQEWLAALLAPGLDRPSARAAWRALRAAHKALLITSGVGAAGAGAVLEVLSNLSAQSLVASNMGGQRAVAIASALARCAQRVATSHSEFAAHACIQQEHAVTWRCASYAASQLGGEPALQQASELALEVQRIATSHPDFAAHVGIQREQAEAWHHASFAASELGGERGLQQARELALEVQRIATSHPDFAAHAGIQQQQVAAWCKAAYAAGQLGGERGLQQARELALQVQRIATSHPDFAAHAGIQKRQAEAWRYPAYAASQLGGERALQQACELASVVRCIATSHLDFAAHAGIQRQQAEAWCYTVYAAGQLGGERALQQAGELALDVRRIALSHPDLAAHVGIQEQHAQAWTQAAYAASELGGERGLQQARGLALEVQRIAMSHPSFASHAGIQQAQAAAWCHAAYAASQLGGERGLQQARGLALEVQRIAISHPSFASHAGIQQAQAAAWCTAAYAAGQLGGERGLQQARGLALEVQRIATAHADFSAHPGIQQQQAEAWCKAVYAACRLGGERALQQVRELALEVQRIATAHPDFVADAGIQEQLVMAWQFVAFAGYRAPGSRGIEVLEAAAQQVWQLVSQPCCVDDPKLQGRWREVKGWLRERKPLGSRTFLAPDRGDAASLPWPEPAPLLPWRRPCRPRQGESSPHSHSIVAGGLLLTS